MSNIKKVSLDFAERLKAVSILNEFKGSLDGVAVILEDIKQLPIEEEELKQAGGRISNEGRTMYSF